MKEKLPRTTAGKVTKVLEKVDFSHMFESRVSN
ncbi:MAG: hypothetical protein CHKLHMKO_00107 [Candidatus Argoarchaeum ethanivorans]|uniref:Uncharacterized protein n=1 Tax=Candidatus Argoarchaeum ethanivorans TaxID=2608793 RepID=A0A811T976_9EURY|nr:MAG: hypothetical protein CHKLHMKO_00107 [Candidatus Argoarchaeum ethanivorans]